MKSKSLKGRVSLFHGGNQGTEADTKTKIM
jgi:hypothetical protein